MIFLIVIFFIISPIIILYTIGYRYNAEEGRLTKTGVLTIDLKPDDATVTLNNVLLDQRIPIELTNYAPGQYHVKVEKEGYHTWEKEVKIESKQTTYIKDIILPRSSLPIRIVDEQFKNILDAHISYDGKYIIFLTQEKKAFEVYVYDTKRQTHVLLTRSQSAKQPRISWSPYYNTAVIQYDTATKNLLEIFDANNVQGKRSFTLSAPLDNKSFQWIDHRQHAIAVLHKGNISYYSPRGKEHIGEADSKIFFVDADLSIWEYNQKNNVVSNKDKEKSIQLTGDPIREIFVITDDLFIGKTSKHVVIIPYKENGQQTQLPTSEIVYDAERKEWITWSPWEIWRINETGESTLLNRVSEEISFANTIDEHGTIGISTDDSLASFDPEYNVRHELFENGIIKKTGINKKERNIFFLGAIGHAQGLFELSY